MNRLLLIAAILSMVACASNNTPEEPAPEPADPDTNQFVEAVEEFQESAHAVENLALCGTKGGNFVTSIFVQLWALVPVVGSAGQELECDD